MKHARTSTALATLIATSILGCKPPAATPPPAPVTGFVVPPSRAASTTALVDHTSQFNQFIDQMPGSSGAEHRQLLVGSLGELSQILQLANGSVQSPEFANRIAVINAAIQTASIQSLPRPRLEAVENQAIQAAGKALAEIQSRYLFDDDQLPPLLDAIDAKTSAATDVMGPLHDLDATDAFRAIQTTVQRITDDMVERFGTPGTADETPAPTPAVAPATTPTAPATMP